jgi:hypothetical protein
MPIMEVDWLDDVLGLLLWGAGYAALFIGLCLLLEPKDSTPRPGRP